MTKAMQHFFQKYGIAVAVVLSLFFLIGGVITVFIMFKNTQVESSRPSPMGTPPLEERIFSADTIILARTESSAAGFVYRVLEVWKATDQSSGFANDSTLLLNTKIHEQLGYVPEANETVVLFFGENFFESKTPSEVLPVKEGNILYAPNDTDVRQVLTVEEVEKKIKNF